MARPLLPSVMRHLSNKSAGHGAGALDRVVTPQRGANGGDFKLRASNSNVLPRRHQVVDNDGATTADKRRGEVAQPLIKTPVAKEATRPAPDGDEPRSAIRAAAEPGQEVLGCPWEQCSQYRRSVSNAKTPCESKTHIRSPVLRNVGPRVASAGRRYPAFRPAAASSSSPHEPRPISTSSHSLRGISPEVTSRIVANLTRSD